jgi:hypothetical protein
MRGDLIKLTKQQFCDLMNRREELKIKRKALQAYQERQDINAVNNMRCDRIYKKSKIVV